MIPDVSRQLLPSLPQVVAVIPGLAPGIVAILPHLFLLLVASLTLVASPRSWWRVLVGCARHPGRTLVALVLGGVAFGAARGAIALIPTAVPGAAIGSAVHGFDIGDPHSSGVRSRGPGPLTTPAVRAFALPAALPDPRVIAAEGTRVVVSSGGRRIAALDLETGRASWTIDLPGELTAAVVPFRRQVDGVSEQGLILPVAPGERGGLLFVSGGTVRSRFELPSPPRAACVADDRIVVALDGELIAIAMTGPEAPREVWREPRPEERAVGIAADENGYFYLLDAVALRSGDLAGGSLEALTPVEEPRGLAVRAGLAYVLEGAADRALLRCVAPAAPRGDRWSASIEAPLSVTPVAAEFGVIVTTARGFEIRDRFSGALVERVELSRAPATAVVATDLSCFALLENGAVARYSPGLRRVAWSVEPDGPSEDPTHRADRPSPAASDLLPAARALIAIHSGRAYLLRERETSEQLPWSHARGGADRAGSTPGAQAPLVGEVTWRAQLPGTFAGGAVPVEGGWLIARADGDQVRLVRGTNDGQTTVARELEGTLRALARHGERVLLALAARDGSGRVVALDGGRTTFDPLWEAPLPDLGRRNVLAASEDSIVVALPESIRCLSVRDGGRRWESDAVRGAEAPLIANGVVFAVGESPSGAAIVAIGGRDGELLWRHETPGSSGSTSFRDGTIYVGLSSAERDGRVLSLNPADGAVNWEFRTGTPILGPVSLSEEAVVVRAAGTTQILNHAGKRLGLLEWDGSARTVPAPVLAPGVAIVADGLRVRCIDAITLDSIWETKLAAPIDSLALDGERVLALAGSELVSLGAEE